MSTADVCVELSEVSPSAKGGPWRCLLHWHFAVLLGVIVFFGAIRWRLLDLPLERDEGEYAYTGQLLLQGIPPYQLAYNMKLPGTYAAYAAILAVFGQTARGIHLGLLLVNAISVVLIYVIAAQLFGTLAGAVAGASYALLSTHQGVLGFMAHATHFVVLAALVGLVLVLRAVATRRTAYFLWAGLAFGVAFLMKQPGILFGAFAFLYLAYRFWPKDKSEWSPWARKLGVFLMGWALPFALTCILLYRAGVFRNFWFWTFEYARQYGTIVSLSTGWGYLKNTFLYLVFSTAWLWALCLVGISAVFWAPSLRRHSVFVFGLLFLSGIAVCAGLFFRPHYYILMLPAVALSIAVGVTCSIDLLTARFTSQFAVRWIRILPVIVFAAACGIAIYRNADFYFRLTPAQASHLCYPKDSFPDALPIAEYLRQHTAPTDRIMVFGSEPEIYFYAHRHSASGYIYAYSLMEDQNYWPVMQRQMMAEVEASRPAYVVIADTPALWSSGRGSRQAVALATLIDQYLMHDFEEVGVVELAPALPAYRGFADLGMLKQDNLESRYFWEGNVGAHRQTGSEFRILKRKA
jgi:4-amino-4-deoxy-L-arabinose transferase-like glycosyltransferase